MAKNVDELTRDIEREVATVQATRRINEIPETRILDACRKAADYIRDVYKQHSSEGEALAKHIEQVGETFNDHCKDVAKEIRELHLVPEATAAKQADELLHFGKLEQERHANVTQSLTAMGEILRAINAAKEAQPDANGPDAGSRSPRPIDSGRKD